MSYLRVEFALRIFIGQIERQIQWLEGDRIYDRTMRVDDLDLNPPPEIDQGWASLHLFPVESVVVSLANIRSTLQTIKTAKEIYPTNKVWTYKRIGQPSEIRSTVVIFQDLAKFCRDIVRELEQETGSH